MKILFVIQGMKSGGAERVMSLLCNNFAKRGYDVLLALTETSASVSYQIDSNVRILDISLHGKTPGMSRLKQIKGLRRIYKSERPDVVISFITRTNICAILAGIFLNIPIIVSERNNPLIDPKSKKTRILRDIVYPFASGYVFQTEFAKNCFPKRIQEKAKVIFNPVSKDVLKEKDNLKEKRIISVGRLDPQKNFPLLIRAAAKILNNHNDYHVEIFGTGILKEQLQKEIEKLNMQDRIFLKGYTNQSIKEMSSSEIFVITSNFEGMPNALMEAMCVGCACISTDSPAYGARELIQNNENGVLVPIDNEEILSSELNKLLENSEKIYKFGEQAKKIYNKFSVDSIMEQWSDYIKLVTKKVEES